MFGICFFGYFDFVFLSLLILNFPICLLIFPLGPWCFMFSSDFPFFFWLPDDISWKLLDFLNLVIWVDHTAGLSARSEEWSQLDCNTVFVNSICSFVIVWHFDRLECSAVHITGRVRGGYYRGRGGPVRRSWIPSHTQRQQWWHWTQNRIDKSILFISPLLLESKYQVWGKLQR